MVTRQEIAGKWNEVKGRLKEHWAELTDEDFRNVQGSAERLVGVVQQKTGARKSEIESFIDGIFSGNVAERASEAVGHYADSAQQVASDAADYARKNYRKFAASTDEYSQRVSETVRSRPVESLAIAFGVGIAAGALLFFGRKR
ncbi:CsbD family protein [Stieleria varia]|uniref:CsbD-like domain-containing protein n=1 Tax=Stieleria varia TaxID=2528005 RepID=A0A5C6B841_9BACT|nr:CsbD family protein [Stieleria varia]TWU08435.1 hypothetical protein Pla52n_10180 [Stieleria varia]